MAHLCGSEEPRPVEEMGLVAETQRQLSSQ